MKKLLLCAGVFGSLETYAVDSEISNDCFELCKSFQDYYQNQESDLENNAPKEFLNLYEMRDLINEKSVFYHGLK